MRVECLLLKVCDPEIGDQELVVSFVVQDVFWFQVPMRHSLQMGSFYAIEKLREVEKNSIRRNASRKKGPERLFVKRHDVEWRTLLAIDKNPVVIDGDDVSVLVFE